MNQNIKTEIRDSIRNFRLPRYEELPDVGLYLEQVTKYISDYLAPLEDIQLTGSMISNYVKKGLIQNPVRKQYTRDQVAYLIFVAVSKTVLSMDDIQQLIELQKKVYTSQRAYDYFCSEFENVLFYVFGLKDVLDTVGIDATDEKAMLRNTIITVAHKIYLDKCFSRLSAEKNA